MGTSATAVYVRQSKDKSGHAEAVDRQEEACQLLARAKDWDDVRLYSDNDISATSGKRRPSFEELLRDVEDGVVQRIVVWHLDRLTRSMRDLTRIIDAGRSRGLNIASVHGVSLDLGDPTGVAVAQILTAVAAMEVAHKGERQKAANQQRAKDGKAFWTRRPFGYDRQGGEVFMVEAEAEAIRDGAQSLLSGATLASVAADWNGRGLLTTFSKQAAGDAPARGGLPWNVTSVRRVYLNPRYAGRRLYNGADMGDGDWPAILTPGESEELERLLTDPRRRTAPDDLTAKYLLSGIAVCGKCGRPMHASPMRNRGREWMVYRCYGGYCLARRLDLVDEVVEAALLARLLQPQVASRLSPAEDVKALQQQVTELRDRRDGLVAMGAEGLLSMPAVREQAGKLTQEITALEDEIARASVTDPVSALAASDDVLDAWEATPIAGRRKIVRSLMDVRVMPAGKGVRFAPEQVQIGWR